MTNFLLGLILATILMTLKGAGPALGLVVFAIVVLAAFTSRIRTKKCNQCSETVLKDAVVCKHCHNPV